MCAFSVTLLGVGLVTTIFVTIVGFIIGLIAAVGWFRSEEHTSELQSRP